LTSDAFGSYSAPRCRFGGTPHFDAKDVGWPRAQELGLAMNCRWCFASDSEWIFIGVHYVWYMLYLLIIIIVIVILYYFYSIIIIIIIIIYILHMMIKLINYTTLQYG